jgi:hypothetical protein
MAEARGESGFTVAVAQACPTRLEPLSHMGVSGSRTRTSSGSREQSYRGHRYESTAEARSRPTSGRAAWRGYTRGVVGRLYNLAVAGRRWLQDQADFRQADSSRLAYPWLNTLLIRAVRADPRLRRDYLWGSLQAAHLAQSLGIEHLSFVEFGVAGGDGLVALEGAAAACERFLGVRADVYGFDTGHGLPKPRDVRDLPNLFVEGDYGMDVDALRARLTRAQLVLGDVADTVPEWIEHNASPPIGFASFDLDLYSSTADALAVLEMPTDRLLPRVHCYFDDTTGFTYGDFNGERRAIAEFNEKHDDRKISPFYGLRHYVPARCANDLWVHKFWLAHILDHPLYGEPDGLTRVSELPLSS